MKNLKTEYLVSLTKQGSLFENSEAFKNILRADSKIILEDRVIKYKELTIGYEIQVSELKDERFFHLKFNCNWESQSKEDLDNYEQFLKSIKTILFTLPIRFSCLWDDISLYYSTKAYPLIHEIENLMRKLITKFMITSVGINWEDETLPKEIKSAINNTKNRTRKELNNFLYELDFIHLSDFLFKPYHNHPVDELYNKIRQAKTSDDLIIDELKAFIPESNWQRYFSGLVEYEDSQLQKKWEDIYQLRCKIAHNNKINKNDFRRIKELVAELKEKLENAVNKLDKIEISEDEKEIIAENATANKTLKARFAEALKAGGTEALKELIASNIYLNIASAVIEGAVVEGWQSADSEQ